MSILIWQWSINYNKVLAYKIWTEFHFFDQNGSWSFLQCDDFIVTYKIKRADTNTIYISKICCTFTILTLSWDKKNPVCHHTWVQLWNGECPLNEFTRLSTTLTHPTHITLGRGPQHIVAPCFLKKTLQNRYTNQSIKVVNSQSVPN